MACITSCHVIAWLLEGFFYKGTHFLQVCKRVIRNKSRSCLPCTQLCDLLNGCTTRCAPVHSTSWFLYGCTTRHVLMHSTSWLSVRHYYTTCACALNFMTFCSALLHDMRLCTQLHDDLYGCTTRHMHVHSTSCPSERQYYTTFACARHRPDCVITVHSNTPGLVPSSSLRLVL